MSLSRDAILGAQDTLVEKVPVPEWGGDVIVRGLSGTDLDSYQDSCRVFNGVEMMPALGNARAKLLVRCLVDEAGERLFGDEDVDELGRKAGRIIDRLYDVAARLSGITEEMQAELEGNSAAAPSGGSASSSPVSSAALSPSS